MPWWREMTAQLDRHAQAILVRLEELLGQQHTRTVEAVMNLHFAAPADHATLMGPPQPYKPAWEEKTPVTGLPLRFGSGQAENDSPSRQISESFAKHVHIGRGNTPQRKGGAVVVDAATQTPDGAAGGSGVRVSSHWEEDDLDEVSAAQQREMDIAESVKFMDVPTGAAATLAFVMAEEGKGDRGAESPGWRRIVKSERFDVVSGCVIILNALVMICRLEWVGIQNAHRIGANEDDGYWPGASTAFLILDHIFSVIFAAELAARLAAYGTSFFCALHNWIDIVTVVLSVFELYIAAAMKIVLPNLTFLRLLRLAKLVKVLRIVRVMRLFHQLRVIMVAIGSSLSALGWSIVFLTIVQIIAAILMTQLIADYLGDPANPIEVRREAYHYFGRWTYSALTMYQITLAPGPWAPIGRLLIYRVNIGFAAFFVLYGWIVTFAVVRVISALFLKQTLAAAAGDGEVAVIERMERKDKDVARLLEIFDLGDADHSGMLDWDEFQAMMSTPKVAAWLSMLELDIHDMSQLFRLLDDGDGQVSHSEFVAGVLRCRGGARGVDISSLLATSRKLGDELLSIRHCLEEHGVGIPPPRTSSIVCGPPPHLDEGAIPSLSKIDQVLRPSKSLATEGDTSEWRAFVQSQRFDMIVGVLVTCNAVVMAVELEYHGLVIGAQLGENSWSAARWHGAETMFLVFDYTFTIIFLVELILRVAASGVAFVKQAVNWIDTVTVVASCFEVFVLSQVGGGIGFVRLLRLLRVTKALRIVRVIRVFHQLRVLVGSLAATVGSLLWSMLFLAVVQSICAIMMTQSLAEFLADPDPGVPLELQATIHEYFGRWTQSMLTLHQLTLAPAAWGSIGRILIFNVSPLYAVFFLVFGWCVTFAIVNVLSAIFLKQTLAAAAGDSDVAVIERMQRRARDIQRLRAIFSEGDKDGSGTLDWHEFVGMIQNPRVRAWLGVMELDVTDMSTVFSLLDDGDGRIEFEEFITGVMRCRGAARGVDVVALVSELRVVTAQVKAIKRGLPKGLGMVCG